jgi:hypothetical protein
MRIGRGKGEEATEEILGVKTRKATPKENRRGWNHPLLLV